MLTCSSQQLTCWLRLAAQRAFKQQGLTVIIAVQLTATADLEEAGAGLEVPHTCSTLVTRLLAPAKLQILLQNQPTKSSHPEKLAPRRSGAVKRGSPRVKVFNARRKTTSGVWRLAAQIVRPDASHRGQTWVKLAFMPLITRFRTNRTRGLYSGVYCSESRMQFAHTLRPRPVCATWAINKCN